MNRRVLNTLVVFGGLAAVVAVGCATTESSKMAQMTPEQAVAERQKMMKANGDAWKNVQDKAKAGDIKGLAADANVMAQNAKKIPAMFPQGSLVGKTAAKPEIWQKWAEFEAAAKNMETEAVKLRDTAQTGATDATQALVKDFGRKACGSCHQPFRVPPPRTS
jgi:cytochrome c556